MESMAFENRARAAMPKRRAEPKKSTPAVKKAAAAPKDPPAVRRTGKQHA